MAKKSTSKTPTINNLVVISDQHINCRLGLCPPDGIHLDDGGEYHPSKLQKVVWAWWEEFWNEFVPKVCHGEPFAVVNNGDAIDGGAHHKNKAFISDNEVDQENLAVKVLKPVVEACEGRYYHIRGTEVHAGASGCNEERLAKTLGAIPDDEGRYARWRMWVRLGGRAMVNICHHIGTTGSMHYESSALSKEIGEAYIEAGRWGYEPPDVLVRSHRHRHSEVRLQSKRGFVTCVTTPGWQLMTPFAYRIPGARQAMPQIGAVVIRQGDTDVYTRPFVKSMERDKEVVL